MNIGSIIHSNFLTLRRRLRLSLKRISLRVNFFLRTSKKSDLQSMLFPWSDLASEPGDRGVLDLISKDNKFNASSLRLVKSRDIEVFPNVIMNVAEMDCDRKKIIIEGMANILGDVGDYQVINWHSDFQSKFNWSPDVFFLDIDIYPRFGVDVKVPRELSRFQHIPYTANLNRENWAFEFMRQSTDWIISNPVSRGVNWQCSMDIAIRSVNWIWGLWVFKDYLSSNSKYQNLVLNSLRAHGHHIYKNLDYYGEEIPTSNHYLSGIAGLIYIGAAMPQIPEADVWLSFGIQELISEISREVYSDGSNHEGSTSYHRLVTELFTSCAALVERIPSARKKMLKNVNIRRHTQIPILRP